MPKFKNLGVLSGLLLSLIFASASALAGAANLASTTDHDQPKSGVPPLTLVQTCGVSLENVNILTDWRITGFKNAPVALFPRGAAAQMLASTEQLLGQAVDVVMIGDPSPEDIALLQHADGFVYGPSAVTWNQKAAALDQRLTGQVSPQSSFPTEDQPYVRSASKRRANLKRATTIDAHVERLPLTPELLEKFYREVYRPFMANLEGREDNIGSVEEFYKKRAAKIAEGSQYYVQFIWGYNSVADAQAPEGDQKPQKRILGAYIIEHVPHLAQVNLDKAAFDTRTNDDLKKANLALRSFEWAMEWAVEMGAQTLSIGTDAAGYTHFDYILEGLAKQKSDLGFRPLFVEGEWSGPFQKRLFRILNYERLGPSYLTFAFKAGQDGNGAPLDMHYFSEKFGQRWSTVEAQNPLLRKTSDPFMALGCDFYGRPLRNN